MDRVINPTPPASFEIFTVRGLPNTTASNMAHHDYTRREQDINGRQTFRTRQIRVNDRDFTRQPIGVLPSRWNFLPTKSEKSPTRYKYNMDDNTRYNFFQWKKTIGKVVLLKPGLAYEDKKSRTWSQAPMVACSYVKVQQHSWSSFTTKKLYQHKYRRTDLLWIVTGRN